MSNFLTTESYKDCAVCAYHESGHILFAYLCGYKCRHVELIPETVEGYSSIAIIDYGNDSMLASKFLNGETNLHYFKSLPLGLRLESIEVGGRLSRLLLGGSVAAAVFNNSGNVHIPLPIQVDYSDLLKVEWIHYVLKEIGEQEENLIDIGLQDALYTISNINVWDTIVDLAERLLAGKQLDKNDIEECLEKHGILYNKESSGGISFEV